MTQRPIMDSGPDLNFFATNKERLLFATLGPLAIPEIVKAEICRRANQDQHFAAAERALSKIPQHLLEILFDHVTVEPSATVIRLT